MKIFYYLFALMIFYCCSEKPKEPITLEIKKIGELLNKSNSTICYYYAPNQVGYQVTAEVKNNTDKNIYYWSMSCNYGQVFRINDKGIRKIGAVSCDQNVPNKFELKPHQKKSFNFYLLKNIEGKVPDSIANARLGLVLIDDIYNQNFDMNTAHILMNIGTTDENSKKIKQIIWSNSIDLSN